MECCTSYYMCSSCIHSSVGPDTMRSTVSENGAYQCKTGEHTVLAKPTSGFATIWPTRTRCKHCI
jgi:hypothetical protein